MSNGPISADRGLEAHWVEAVPLAQLTDGAMIPVDVGTLQLIVVRDARRVFAVERACPHEMADLLHGFVDDGRIHCPRHAASFDLGDGTVSSGWTCRALRRYPIRIENNVVFIRI